MITRIQSNNTTKNPYAFKGLGAEKILTKAADCTSVHQRLAIGVAALAFQPIIDLNNKEIDKETRKISALRSAAKAIIGTVIGLAVRAGTIAVGARAFAKKDAAGKILKDGASFIVDEAKVQRIFGESLKKSNLQGEELANTIKRIPAAVGTIASLGVMIITNFAIDAPLTNVLMNQLNKVIDKRSKNKEQKVQEVNNG